MQTRWLIIGCGYLGQPLARQLAQRGAAVWASTRSPERAEQFRQLGWQPIRLEVTDPDAGDPLPEVDVLVWAVGFDRAAGRAMSAVYVEGLRAVLARLPSLPANGRLLYISSTGVYGQRDGSWVNEDSPAEPVTESGRVCRQAELALLDWASSVAGPAPNVLRMSGIYGTDRWPGLATLRTGRPLTGRPDRWLNLIHVADAVSSVIATAEVGRPGRTYLVSDDSPTQRGDYYRALATHFDTPQPRFPAADERSNTHESNQASEADPSDRRVCNARLRAELGVSLRYPSFRVALAECTGGRPGQLA